MERFPNLSSYPSLADNETAYTRGFERFREKVNDVALIQEWIRERFEKRVVENIVHSQRENAFRVLGIGSGDGEFEFQMLVRLAKKFPVIECTVVEPSEKRINLYRKLVEQRKAELKDVTWIWREEKLEQFLGREQQSRKFDLVICVHVLYYISMAELDERLEGLCSLLTKRGQLLIVHNQESKNLKLVDKLNLNRRPAMALNHRVIRNALLNLNMSFTVEETLPVVIDVTECFDACSNEDGTLLDFIVCTDPTWRTPGKPGEVDAVVRLIKEGCIQSDGKWIFPYPTSVMLCQNSK